jgi:hypothetical protein
VRNNFPNKIKFKEPKYDYVFLQPAQKAKVIAGKRMGLKKKFAIAEAQVAEKPKLERVK